MLKYKIMNIIEKNNEYIVEIEGYNSEGAGVARVSGRAVFIPRTVLGEVWHIKILKVTASAVYAKGLQKMKASENAVLPKCTYFGKCGGCDTWHMTYEEELRFKLEKVNDALQRIGKQTVKAQEIIASADPERYRNKGIFNVALQNGKAVYGFYRERSHDLIAIDKCLIQRSLGEKASAVITAFLNQNQILPYDEQTGKGTVRHIYCRTAVYTNDAVVCIISARGFGAYTEPLVNELRHQIPELTGIVLCINKERLNSVLSGTYHTLYGNPDIRDFLCNHEFVISPQAFYQINPPQAEKLYQKAVEYAVESGAESVLELYCGAGTISLSLSEHFQHVEATEIVPEAVANAKKNAERNHIYNVTFSCEDAAQTAARYSSLREKPGCIVVDPPRKGMDEVAVQTVAAISSNNIVYVSCNPATLARDILRFQEYGYQLKKATAVDMFPRTCHVETVALLSR